MGGAGWGGDKRLVRVRIRGVRVRIRGVGGSFFLKKLHTY